MSYHELEKNFADLKVNLMPWEKYIYPFHSVELKPLPGYDDRFACLLCRMVMRDGTGWTRETAIDEVLMSEQIHEMIGASVRAAYEHLVAWARQQEK